MKSFMFVILLLRTACCDAFRSPRAHRRVKMHQMNGMVSPIGHVVNRKNSSF
jgi:hypothetical protein